MLCATTLAALFTLKNEAFVACCFYTLLQRAPSADDWAACQSWVTGQAPRLSLVLKLVQLAQRSDARARLQPLPGLAFATQWFERARLLGLGGLYLRQFPALLGWHLARLNRMKPGHSFTGQVIRLSPPAVQILTLIEADMATRQAAAHQAIVASPAPAPAPTIAPTIAAPGLSPMKIAIDLQGAQNDSRFRGIGRYSTAFVQHLLVAAAAHEVVLVLNGAFPDTLAPLRAAFPALHNSGRIHVWHPTPQTAFAKPDSCARRLASELIREAFIASLQPDVVIVTSLFEGCGDAVVTSIGAFSHQPPVAVVVYDFIPHLYPDAYLGNATLKAWYASKLAHLGQAALLLAISNSARAEAIDLLRIGSDQVVSISAAVDAGFHTQSGTALAALQVKFRIAKPFLMCAGASDPRKNLPRLLAAFARLPPAVRSAHQLVLVGAMPPSDVQSLQRTAKTLGLSSGNSGNSGPADVLFLGQVPDADLVGLYGAARAYIMASYHEGFGLPILEAMACGVPVIASNASSMPEVVGLAEALFDPHDTDDMAQAIQRVLQDEAFRQRLVAHGLVQCRLFSWQAVAETAVVALVARFGGAAPAPALPVAPALARQAALNQLIARIGALLVAHPSPRTDTFQIAAAIASSLANQDPAAA